MSPPILQARLQAGYGAVSVLREIDFQLCAGESLALVGTSGAGKSTLVHALLGLSKWREGWTRGEVIVAGQNLLTLKPRELRRLLGKTIALVPQSPMTALNPMLSLDRHFQEAWRAHQPDRQGLAARVQQLAEQLELPTGSAFWRRKPAEISVGQAQRATIALALLHQPPLLIADEPTSALDPTTQVEVLRLLRQVVQENQTALLYISHDLTSVLQLCESIAILSEGCLSPTYLVDNLSHCAPPELSLLLGTLPVPLDVLLRYTRMPVSALSNI